MQKIIKIESWNNSFGEKNLSKHLNDGWRVVSQSPLKDILYFIVEKPTRKEKLEYLNEK